MRYLPEHDPDAELPGIDDAISWVRARVPQSMVIMQQEPVQACILDKHGKPLTREKRPIGFNESV